jgi:hypothetical protein
VDETGDHRPVTESARQNRRIQLGRRVLVEDRDRRAVQRDGRVLIEDRDD